MAATARAQTYTRDLAAFAHDMRLADVPPEAQHEAHRILIDCLGCGVAGLSRRWSCRPRWGWATRRTQEAPTCSRHCAPASRWAGTGGAAGIEEMGATRGSGNVVFGAAVAAGRLLGLTAEQMHNALGIAGYSATVPTMRKYLSSRKRAMPKYDQPGVDDAGGRAGRAAGRTRLHGRP